MRPFRHLSVLVCGALLASASLALAPLPALAAGTLDQSQEVLVSGAGMSGDYSMAQTFTTGVTGLLDRASLYVGGPSGLAEDVGVQIGNTVAGVPGSALLATGTIASSAMSDSGTWLDIDFAEPAWVESGAIYAIVLPALSAGSFGIGFAGGDTYVGGDLFLLYSSQWGWELQDLDLMFRTYVTAAPLFTTPQPLGNWRADRSATDEQLPVDLGTYTVDNFASAKAVFDASNCALKKADALGCLAGQLLTVELNVKSGSDVCIVDVVADADALLAGKDYTGPGSYSLTKAQRGAALTLKGILSTYNAGLGCPA